MLMKMSSLRGKKIRRKLRSLGKDSFKLRWRTEGGWPKERKSQGRRFSRSGNRASFSSRKRGKEMWVILRRRSHWKLDTCRNYTKVKMHLCPRVDRGTVITSSDLVLRLIIRSCQRVRTISQMRISLKRRKFKLILRSKLIRWLILKMSSIMRKIWIRKGIRVNIRMLKCKKRKIKTKLLKKKASKHKKILSQSK